MGTSSPHGPTRRRFLTLGGTGLVLIPLVNLTGCGTPEDVPPERAPGVDRTTPEQPMPAAPPATPPQVPPATPADATREFVFLDEGAPDAQALSYVHDAADVDADAHARYEPGQVCANCALFQAQVDGVVQTEDGQVPVGEVPGWGGCTIFPGRLVNADGWCSAWVPMS